MLQTMDVHGRSITKIGRTVLHNTCYIAYQFQGQGHIVCMSHLCLFLIRETKQIRGGRGHTVSGESSGHTSCSVSPLKIIVILIAAIWTKLTVECPAGCVWWVWGAVCYQARKIICWHVISRSRICSRTLRGMLRVLYKNYYCTELTEWITCWLCFDVRRTSCWLIVIWNYHDHKPWTIRLGC